MDGGKIYKHPQMKNYRGWLMRDGEPVFFRDDPQS